MLLYFYVFIFAASAVLLLRSLIQQRWNELPVFFILLAMSFISISTAISFTNIYAVVNRFESAFGGAP